MIKLGRITSNNSYNIGWSHEDGNIALYNIDMNVMWRGTIGYSSSLKADVEHTHDIDSTLYNANAEYLKRNSGDANLEYMNLLLNSSYNDEAEGCSPHVFMFRVNNNEDYHHNKLMYLIHLNCYGFHRWVLMDTSDIRSLKLHVPIFMGDTLGMFIDELDSVDSLVSYIKGVTGYGSSITDSHSFNEMIGTVRGMLQVTGDEINLF